MRPKWNSNVGVLSFGVRIVKRFPRAARNQEIILSAFEEEGWPPRIDDPLPPSRATSSQSGVCTTRSSG